IHTMFPNASLPTHILTFSKDDQATKVVSAGLVNVSIILYTLTVVLGITGNSIVIWVAGFKLKVDIKCRIYLKYLLRFLDRMVCIWWPVFTRRRRTLWVARMVAVCVWIAAILFSIPYFIHRQTYIDNNNLTKCSVDSIEKAEGYNSTKVALYSIRFLCGFIFPFMVILICYTLAGVGIRRTRLSGKSRPLRVIACLVIAFFLCWAPYHCLLMVKMVDNNIALLKILYPVAMGIAYFNSCVNPLLYFCMGLKMSEGFRQGLMKIYRRALSDDMDVQTTQCTEHSLD
uniref:G-protein coupled receptors family 1 profile domain-containing protein n=1 Tax=Neolamprologus brichardi TaxID=32507 RepID=A0A3Q4G818_NEOBR